MGVQLLVRGARSRLHTSLLGHRYLRDIVTGIRVAENMARAERHTAIWFPE